MEGGNNSSSKFIVSKATLHKLKPQAYSSFGWHSTEPHIHAEELCLWRFITASKTSKKTHKMAFFREESFFGWGDCLHCNPWPKGQRCCENSMVSVTISATLLSSEGHCHSVSLEISSESATKSRVANGYVP